MAAAPVFDGPEIVHDLVWLSAECQVRCLVDSRKWADEMLHNVPTEWRTAAIRSRPYRETCAGKLVTDPLSVSSAFHLAQSCMQTGEFMRAASFLVESTERTTPWANFLYYYARYLAGEKRRLDNAADTIDRRTEYLNDETPQLYAELTALKEDNEAEFDAFFHYLYGLVLKSQKLMAESRKAFLAAVNLEPILWPAWFELSKYMENSADIAALNLPTHWLTSFFKVEAFLAAQLTKDAIDLCETLLASGFARQSTVICWTANAHHHLQAHDMAHEFFETVRQQDPYRIEHMDIYSNSLFIAQRRHELAMLVNFFYKHNKFQAETCMIVGNYYSLRQHHEKAIQYFHRALRLNPRLHSAWCLIGHEFLEIKNPSAASLSYNHAIELNPRDYRGWYGMGQLYDVLRMHAYSYYYYQKAHQCKPEDSRMLMAMGDICSKLNRIGDAQRCYYTAYKSGDLEGNSLIQLGKMFELENDNDQAAMVYEKYLKIHQSDWETSLSETVPHCAKFLTNYCIERNRLSEATNFAQLCMDFDMSKDDGRTFLRRIAQMQQGRGGAPITVTPAAESRSLRRPPNVGGTPMAICTPELQEQDIDEEDLE